MSPLRSSPLRSEDKRALLAVARKAIFQIVLERRELRVSSPADALAVPSGAFVTLRLRGRLRGCIGRMESEEPLVGVVAQCAAAAAMEDPRFSPVERDELRDLEIEISVLSALEIALPDQVEPGRHGLLISRGHLRGVLLPQVAAEHRWTRERFLEETCRKGGLEPEAWKDPETRIEVFTAEIFSESEFRDSNSAGANPGSARLDHSSSQ
ncbi:MAG TPA: AmmeMemoRadiSam system protein A [Candidatus Acidoferrales bacterium]|nr:AmmeMemoRadiSam system protein A [Candidatus Acidoferrales bacterium]